ncbi:hypothetical protein [Robertkochia flava]|nr:hypothetical protein [Robertkochia marina]
MKYSGKKTGLYLMLAGVVITVIGIITGWYFFIFLIIPIGMFWKGKKQD